MHSSKPSSAASWTCRIDWRPSRWLCVALVALGLMAALSLLASQLPLLAKVPAALLAAAQGFRLARHQAGRPPLSLDWLGGDEPAWVTGPSGVQRLDRVRVSLRGPLATIAYTDASGRVQTLAFWPDTLAASGRRQLRIAVSLSGRSAKPLQKQAA